jgi:hypothetical protein
MTTRTEILERLALMTGTTGGIDSWAVPSAPEELFERLGRIDIDPLSCAQLNQLLLLSHEAGVSEGFFAYYWLTVPEHAYDVRSIEGFDPQWTGTTAIQSIEHLRWGLYRFYVDALLFFGNVRAAYRHLAGRSEANLRAFYAASRVDTDALRRRGASIPLVPIARDNRYLISEMACKSYEAPKGAAELKLALDDAYAEHRARGGTTIDARRLLTGEFVAEKYAITQQQLLFSADDILDEPIDSQADLDAKYERINQSFFAARTAALTNTKYYLSIVNDLDVYVATSMRTRDDFRAMADACDRVFADPRLVALQIRYFDPTMSAAEGHEDKGLIECLMVKCAKALVYSAGDRESYGKDAEAAMALSLGKPVIFYCDSEVRRRFYQEVHPLSRLIQFETGVAVGVMVTDQVQQVSELLVRLFENRMEYDLEQPKPGYYRLRERLTRSVIRLQTSDDLLRETFSNYYRGHPQEP